MRFLNILYCLLFFFYDHMFFIINSINLHVTLTIDQLNVSCVVSELLYDGFYMLVFWPGR